MSTQVKPATRAAEMKRVFDQTFAEPPHLKEERQEELIAVRLAGKPYALRRSQISGLARMRRMVSVPSRIPQLAGVIGLRGLVVPVFLLLDFVEGHTHGNSPQWLAITISEAVLGLAFDELDGLVSLPAHCLYQQEGGSQTGPVRQVAQVGAAVRPILELPLILEQVRSAVPRKGSEDV